MESASLALGLLQEPKHLHLETLEELLLCSYVYISWEHHFQPTTRATWTGPLAHSYPSSSQHSTHLSVQQSTAIGDASRASDDAVRRQPRKAASVDPLGDWRALGSQGATAHERMAADRSPPEVAQSTRQLQLELRVMMTLKGALRVPGAAAAAAPPPFSSSPSPSPRGGGRGGGGTCNSVVRQISPASSCIECMDALQCLLLLHSSVLHKVNQQCTMPHGARCDASDTPVLWFRLAFSGRCPPPPGFSWRVRRPVLCSP